MCLQHTGSHVLLVYNKLNSHLNVPRFTSPEPVQRLEVMPPPSTDTAYPQRDEWEVHRRELFRLFIVDGVPVAEIAEYMRHEYGFDKK